MTADLIEVIETAYRVQLSEREWLAEVARVARPVLDVAGFGVAAWLFDARNPTHVEVLDSAFSGDDPAVHAAMKAASDALARLPRDPRADCHRNGPCQTVSEVLGLGELAEAWEMVTIEARMGSRDMLGIVGADPTGFGLGLGTLLQEPRGAARGEVRRWSRVAAHLAAGYRCRRTLETRQQDAILTPTGKVEHAEEPAKARDARDALRRGALAVDRARGRMRRESFDEAVEVWRGLVAGRWSLVEQFESDGRRFLVARQNDPETPMPPNLSMRERQVLVYRMLGHPLKLIAYELGLSTSTVAACQERALRTLGVASVTDVIRMLTPQG